MRLVGAPADGNVQRPPEHAAGEAWPVSVKEFLECRKLDVEIRKAEADIDAAPANRRFEYFRIAATYLTIALTLLGTVAAAYVQVNTYLSQRAKDLAYAVSKDTNELLKALNEGNPGLQRLAALQLANFGGGAVPLLVESIDIARKETVTEAIVTGLRLIGRGGEGRAAPVDVVTPLMEASGKVFERELHATHASADAMRNHVSALAGVVRPPLSDPTMKRRVDMFLGELADQVERSRIGKEDKTEVLNAIAVHSKGVKS